jgi:hypothetical protein
MWHGQYIAHPDEELKMHATISVVIASCNVSLVSTKALKLLKVHPLPIPSLSARETG